jgi:hypothetical protein
MKRRDFLIGGAAGSILSCLPPHLAAQAASSSPQMELTVDLNAEGRAIPAAFTGLSYEKAQLANPGYFSADNKDLVGLVRRLGRRGVLRIGGNTSDFAIWTDHDVSQKSGAADASVGPDAGLNIDKTTQITPRSIDQLRTFLDATGWDVIYGLDLGHGDPERAAAEAAYAVKRLGAALVVLQIGNEPDLYYRNGLRPSTYTYADYIQEWKKYADAVRKRTPSAPLGGPDIGNHPAWVDSFAEDVPYAKLLTSHYYAEGPPTDPKVNIDRLLRPHPKNEVNMKALVALSDRVHMPYRMSECNSCYHAGKDGVSNSFASALWGADYMLSLAQWGVTGVNFHGGGQGFYTPIAGGGAQPFVARPVYYGMLFFQQFARGKLFPVRGTTETVRAYASLDASRRVHLALINLDQTSDAELTISAPSLRGAMDSLALTAPSLESETGVTLGGGTVSQDGSWRAAKAGTVHANTGNLRINVAKASALVLSSTEAIRA